MAYSKKQISEFKEKIIIKLSEGQSLKSILDNNKELPSRPIVYQWLNEAHENYDKTFYKKYYIIIGTTKKQQSKFCNSNPLGNRARELDDYRILNARKSNCKKYPIANIYLMNIIGMNYYKIGVSQNIIRRHRDLESAMPFNIKILQNKKVDSPYDLEHKIHSEFSEKYVKSEWFKLNKSDVNRIIDIIEEWENKCYGLLRKS